MEGNTRSWQTCSRNTPWSWGDGFWANPRHLLPGLRCVHSKYRCQRVHLWTKWLRYELFIDVNISSCLKHHDSVGSAVLIWVCLSHCPSQGQCRAGLYDLVTSVHYDIFMMVLIWLNVVPLMVESDDLSMETEIILHWTHLFFFLVFFTEFILKMIAFRCSYFSCKWNILDFTLLIIFFLGNLSMKMLSFSTTTTTDETSNY